MDQPDAARPIDRLRALVRKKAEECRSHERWRRSSAQTWRGGTAASWESGRQLAEKMDGRPILKGSKKERLRLAEIDDRIAEKVKVEAELFDEIDALLAAPSGGAPAAEPPPQAPETPLDVTFTRSFDARDWAEAFVAHVQRYPGIPTDVDTMIGWFANAIMRGFDEHRWRQEREAAAVPASREEQNEKQHESRSPVLNLHVLLTRDEHGWLAQGLEIDYAIDGDSVDDVKARFEAGLTLTIQSHLRVYGDVRTLLRIAPQPIWDKFYAAVPPDVQHKQALLTVQSLPFDRIVYVQSEPAGSHSVATAASREEQQP